jgi:putative ABC transport system permease protein
MSESKRPHIFRPTVEEEVAEEFAFHGEMRVRELMEGGLSEEAARAEVQRRLEALRLTEAECTRIGRQRDREQRRTQLVAEFGADVRYALRTLARAPVFTAVALLTIALGIGANAGIFSVLNGVVLRPLAYAEPDRLVRVATQFPGMGFDKFWMSPPEFFELGEQARSFSAVGAYRTGSASVGGDDAPVRVTSSIGTPSLFPVLGVPPLYGRTFLEEESLPGAEPVALLGHGLWTRAFGAEPSIVGRNIQVNGMERRVVGVMPAGFDVADAGVELWTPAVLDPSDRQNRASHYLDVVARLRGGVDIEQARAELRVLAAVADSLHPGVHTWHPDHHPVVLSPLHEDVVGNARTALLLLLGAVGFVLLIACANVANLLLARAAVRQKEIAVRTALGGGRARLMRQFLTEGLVLSVLGGTLGLLLGQAGVRALLATNPDGIPRTAAVGIDGTVLLFTLGITIITGIAFGLAPMLQLSGGSLTGVLREASGRTTAGAAKLRLRRALVLAEVALAAVLLVGCALMLRSFAQLRDVHPGFDPRGVVTFELFLPSASYPGAEPQRVFHTRLYERLEALPAVTSVGAMSGLPPRRELNANDVDFEGIEQRPDGPIHNIDYYQIASEDYLATMRIPLLAGRGFEPSERRTGRADQRANRAHILWVGQSGRPANASVLR